MPSATKPLSTRTSVLPAVSPSPARAARRALVALAALLALWAVAAPASARFQEGPAAETQGPEAQARPEPREAGDGAPGPVIHVRVDSIIQPVVARFLEDALAEADARGAAAFILELDTPGGLVASTRDIVAFLQAADTPVVVYVAPGGAQAASAGFYMLMAADVAAMAPGTNTGAATPVDAGGADIGETMQAKAKEDAQAWLRALAQQHGRDPELVETTVSESRSFSAEEALELGLADVISPNLTTLLQDIDGREIPARAGSEARMLATARAPVERLEMGLFQRILGVIADPTVAYLLFSLGGMAIILELYHPGAILPGVVGAICLILAFFGLSVLPVNYAGVALVLLALVLFIIEIKVTSYGMLTIGGILCLALGGLMLIESPEPALQVSVRAILFLSLLMAVAVLALMTLVLRAHRHQVATGVEGMLHELGRARSALTPRGKVFVHGELWNAEAETPVDAGETVEVVGIDRMLLKVRRASARSPQMAPTREQAGGE